MKKIICMVMLLAGLMMASIATVAIADPTTDALVQSLNQQADYADEQANIAQEAGRYQDAYRWRQTAATIRANATAQQNTSNALENAAQGIANILNNQQNNQ